MKQKASLYIENMNKIDILKDLIQDTQETIRFIESKTSIIIAIIGAILIYYLQDINNIIKYFYSFSCANYFFFILVLISNIFNVFILFKLIFPLNNPISKIPSLYNKFPNLYLSKENLNPPKPKLKSFHESFSDDLNIEKALELEYIKTSYIRNIKLNLYKILVVGVLIQLLFFIIHLIIYNSELIQLTTPTGSSL